MRAVSRRNVVSKLSYWLSGFFGQLGYALDSPESLANAWCRFNGHPNGSVYYSIGTEPDYDCKDCGEDLG